MLIFCTPCRAAHPERLLAEASPDCAEAVLMMLPTGIVSANGAGPEVLSSG